MGIEHAWGPVLGEHGVGTLVGDGFGKMRGNIAVVGGATAILPVAAGQGTDTAAARRVWMDQKDRSLARSAVVAQRC